MCGFAGVVAFDPDLQVSSSALERMLGHVAHRGPDGGGTKILEDSPVAVALGHCRLAILDPVTRSDQPWTDGRGRWIVFNGEIYNFRDLREKLRRRLTDYQWRTEGDTEVLLAAYAAWGEDCVHHVDGMFACAIWDAPARRLFLARDRMGQKPLYVATSPAGRLADGTDATPPRAIAFASELEALREVPWVDRAVDQASIGDYLSWGYIPDPATIYRGIGQLPPGTRAVCGLNGTRVDRYFDPAAGRELSDVIPPATDRAAAGTEPLAGLMRQAVDRQLVSDVPVGCFLSGGMDSSVITLLMCDILRDPAAVRTFSIGFDDPRYDESGYAGSVARHLGTTHHKFIVRPNAAEDLPQLVRVFGQPFADSSALAVHYLARQTRQEIKVVLSGDGGDELFGGYERYRAVAAIERLPQIVRRGMSHSLWAHLPGVHPKSRLTRLKRLLASANQPLMERYAGYMRLFDAASITKLYRGQAGVSGAGQHDWLAEQGRQLAARPEMRGVDSVALVTALDRLTYLPYDLLTKVDRASMLHALEVRSPFMDPALVRFAATLTGRQMLRGGGKALLRKAFAGRLPSHVFTRRKMGFALPVGSWFKGPLRAMLHDHLFASDSFASSHLNLQAIHQLVEEHTAHRIDHGQRLYALLMLELWWRLH